MDFVRRLVVRKKKKSRQAEPPQATQCEPGSALDCLPVPILPSRSTTVDPAPGLVAQPSQFFSLPYELRHQIHLSVLGDREIHLDMAYTAVVSPKPHNTAHARLSGYGWRWHTSTCHRQLDADAGWDKCFSGELPTDCSAHTTSCCIGALNWLLVCRQVYREGIEVLFANNTFHVSTGTILLSPRRFLVPQAVLITSLVLRLGRGSIVQHAKDHLGLERGWPAYTALVNAVPVAFPQLRKLYLVIEDATDPEYWRVEDVAGHTEMVPHDRARLVKLRMLGPVDDIVRAYRGQLNDFHFALEKEAYDCFLADDLASADTVQTGRGWKQFWRPIPMELEEGTTKKMAGYWIKRLGEYVVRRLVTDIDAVYAPVITVEIVE